MDFTNLKNTDPELLDMIKKEEERQEYNIELIASENFTSLSVMEAMGSLLTNKYAEGYPHKRYYGGCEFVDEVEDLARERLKNYLLQNMPMYNHILVHKPIWQFICLCFRLVILY